MFAIRKVKEETESTFAKQKPAGGQL